MEHIKGLVAPVHTPMHPDGSLNLELADLIVAHLDRWGVAGIFVCGSTGEGASLSVAEREDTAEAFAEAARDRMRIIIHVGHNALEEARKLAGHAQKLGVDAVAVSPPSYFKPNSAETVARCIRDVAQAAPELPVYYYHIPALTGVHIDVLELLQMADVVCPQLAGVKFTFEDVRDLAQCVAFEGGRYDILFGRDEMLLSALVVGCRGAVGSTYNYAAPVYTRMMAAFDSGDLDEARAMQLRAARLVGVVHRFGGGRAHKAVMNLIGIDCGPCRLPLETLTPDEMRALEADLRAIGFFEWIG
ncbi:MAG TPA: dihydrodipicolinate synthase family protein [Planctomycetota bacterium]|nr:dihydrodipicolinate synthase family protein [Planctomycetota bacterium]